MIQNRLIGAFQFLAVIAAGYLLGHQLQFGWQGMVGISCAIYALTPIVDAR